MANNPTTELNGVIKFVGELGKDINIYFNVNDPIKIICAQVLDSLKNKHNFLIRDDFEAILTTKINEIVEKNKPKYSRQNQIKTTEGSISTTDIKLKSDYSIGNVKIRKKSERIRASSYNLFKNNFKNLKYELSRLNRAKLFLVESLILQKETVDMPGKLKSKSMSRKKVSIADQEDLAAATKGNNFTLSNNHESSNSLGMKRTSNFFLLAQSKRVNNSKEDSSLIQLATAHQEISKIPVNLKALNANFHDKYNTIDIAYQNRYSELLKLPSFDCLCMNRKKMKKILSKKVYNYIKNCSIVRADQFGYYKSKLNHRQGNTDQLNSSSIFEMSSIFGAKGKRGTKSGYSFLAAKSNFKKQESLLSKEKENAILESSVVQPSFKLKKNSTQKNSSTKEMSFTFKKVKSGAFSACSPLTLSNTKLINLSKKKGGYLGMEEQREVGLRKSSHKETDMLHNIVDELVPSKKIVTEKFAKSGYLVALEANKNRTSKIKSKKQLRQVNKQGSSFNSKLKHEKNKSGFPTVSQEHSLLLDDQGDNISMIDGGISSKSLNQLLEKNAEAPKDDKQNTAKSRKSLNNTLVSLGIKSFDGEAQINIEKPQSTSNKSLSNQSYHRKKPNLNRPTDQINLGSESNLTLHSVQIKPSLSIQDNKSNSNLIAIKKLDLQNLKDDNSNINLEDKISSPRYREMMIPPLTPKMQKCLRISKPRKGSKYHDSKSRKSQSFKKQKEIYKNSPLKKVNEDHINKLYLSKFLIDLKKSKNFCSNEETQACTYLHTCNNHSLAKSSIENIDMYMKTTNGYKNKKMTFNSRTITHHSKQKGTLASINSFTQNLARVKEQSIACKGPSQHILEVKKGNTKTMTENSSSKTLMQRKQITNQIVNSYIERYYEKLLAELYSKVVDLDKKLKKYDDLNIDEKLKKNFLEPIISIFYEKNLVFSLELFVSIGKLIVKDLLVNNN